MIKFLKIAAYIIILIIVIYMMFFLHNYYLMLLCGVLVLVPAIGIVSFIAFCKKVKIYTDADKYEMNRNDNANIIITALNVFSFGVITADISIKSIFYDGWNTTSSAPFLPVIGGKITLPVKFTNSGRYTVSIDNIVLSDIFGIFYRKINTTRHINIDIMPCIIDKVSLVSGNTEMDIHWAANNYAASDGDNSGIREYIPGDRLNAVHWKTTAKKDDIMVREFEKTGSEEYIVLFDFNGKYLENAFDNLYSTGKSLLWENKSFYALWLAAGNEDLRVKYIRTEEDLRNLIGILYSSNPIFDDGLTINAFKRQYGRSRAIYVGNSRGLI